MKNTEPTTTEPATPETTASPEFHQPFPVAGASVGTNQTPPDPGEVFEFGSYDLGWPPSDTEPEWNVTIALIDGRYAATELVVRPPKGQGISRSMLHQLDIHRIVGLAADSADADARDPDLMDKLMALLNEQKLTGDGRLQAIASVYQLAKLQHVPLHQVAADLGVHKKTLQRWAQQAESAGYLSAKDRTW
ncbi:hypothetical protein [Arthrobacter sp. ISL-5]|uniref:hypothetical protein n=1 Tax=Arthrobacter sp. ISL-5 TaxID=2819111 RepID=UPI001BE5B308|nr:hypothetical protein [Arthrobacter sp. ISL-5]MBT2555840.1 hypothetical protein [Arthrobacter sp. ISL-5]